MTLEAVLTWAPLVDELIKAAECTKPITLAIILTIIRMESEGNANAINPNGGATGLMQVMPREANPTVFGDRPIQAELLDPETNITWGIRILKSCLWGGRTLKEALYYYSGGKAWKGYDLYERKYWRPFQKAYLETVRALREANHDG